MDYATLGTQADREAGRAPRRLGSTAVAPKLNDPTRVLARPTSRDETHKSLSG